MKKSRQIRHYNQGYRVSLLALALTSALACPSVLYANESTVSSIVLQNTKKIEIDRAKTVTDFANKTYQTMKTSSSLRFLENRHVADSSTMPSRIFAKLSKNPWQVAPFMPIPERDMGCYYGVPAYKEPLDFDINTTPVDIEADTVSGSIDSTVVYSGNVILTQGDRQLLSDRTTFSNTTSDIVSSGNVVMKNSALTVESQSPVTANMQTQVTSFEDSKYQLHGSVARGSTGNLVVDSQKGTAVIHDARFTTCPQDGEVWSIGADEVYLDENDVFGEAYGSTVYFKDVPVFYFPYINFPISNERKSGLLYPSGGFSSSDGIDFAQPIYFNIAPNYDMTLTPEIMGKRGLVFTNEFRYMPIEGTEGAFRITFLPNDTNWDRADKYNDNQRYLIDIDHESTFFKEDLTIDIDYQQVRSHDYSFVSDIGGDGLLVTDDSLTQSLKAVYDRENYNVGLEVRRYQNLVPEDSYIIQPFALMPALTGSFADNYNGVLYTTDFDVSHFASPDATNYKDFNATRLHIEPGLTYQLFNNRGSQLTAAGKYFFTYYEQDDLKLLPSYYQDTLGFKNLDDNTTRNLYMLNLRGKTTFERKILDLRHTQTIEPELSYTYIPYKNQDEIGLYDTTDRSTDYYSNFSNLSFAGLDRIADKNVIAAGITTRILDPHDRELYRIGISQAYNFVPTRVRLNPNDPESRYPRSPLSVSFDANPFDNITAHAQASYTNETNELINWNAMLEYKDDEGYMAQLSYRFTREGNRTYDDRSLVDLSQIGLQAVIPLGRDFKFIAASYYDLEQSQNIDSKVALRYEDCCYAITFMYENYTKTEWNDDRDIGSRKEQVIGVQFELKGLGSFNVSGEDKPTSTDTHLIPYFNPTNLNN